MARLKVSPSGASQLTGTDRLAHWRLVGSQGAALQSLHEMPLLVTCLEMGDAKAGIATSAMKSKCEAIVRCKKNCSYGDTSVAVSSVKNDANRSREARTYS